MVSVLGKPACVQCVATTRKLDALGVEYEYIDMTSDPSALARAKDLGYLQAPVVIADGKHWSGFDPDRLDGLVN